MQHIDPYSFLGVTPNSTLKELRKAYHNIALLVHPDKGGDPRDMITLECSYTWIKEQLEHAEKNTKTLEEVEKEFADFVAAQEATKPPPISDVIAETVGLPYTRFQEIIKDINEIEDCKRMTPAIAYDLIVRGLYERYQEDTEAEMLESIVKEYYTQLCNDAELGKTFPAAIEHGYGDDMVTDPDDSKPVEHFGKQDVIEYKEPVSFFETKYTSGVSTSEIPTKMTDYTTRTARGMNLTDYRQAFKDLEINNDAIATLFDPNVKDSFEILMEARRLERQGLDP